MIKADKLLKQAAMFERLSLCDNKRDFLKVLAQSVYTFKNEDKLTLNELIDILKHSATAIPQDKKGSEDAKIIYYNLYTITNPGLKNVKAAIDAMNRMFPSLRNANESLLRRYQKVKYPWSLQPGKSYPDLVLPDPTQKDTYLEYTPPEKSYPDPTQKDTYLEYTPPTKSVPKQSYNKRDFLKVLAQNTDASTFNTNLGLLVNKVKEYTKYIPTDKKGSQEAQTVYANINNIEKPTLQNVKMAIDALNKIVPSLSNYPGTLLRPYEELKASWSLPNVNEQVAGVPSVGQPSKQSDESLFNFYYNKLSVAMNKPDMKTMMEYIPKMEQLVSRLSSKTPTEQTSKMVNVGKKLVANAKSKLGIGESTTTTTSTEPTSLYDLWGRPEEPWTPEEI